MGRRAGSGPVAVATTPDNLGCPCSAAPQSRPAASSSATATPRLKPMPFGYSRAESQRDSAPKGCEPRATLGKAGGVGQPQWGCGPMAEMGHNPVEDRTDANPASRTRQLGWRTQSLWDCRTSGLSVVPHSTDLARNIRKALRLNPLSSARPASTSCTTFSL